MWYVILLLCSVGNSCFCTTMSFKTLYKDKPVAKGDRALPTREQLLNSALEYHQMHAGGELQDLTESSPKERLVVSENKNLYARCIAYLTQYKNEAAVAISSDGSMVVHGVDDQLAVFPYATHEQQAIVLNIENDHDEYQQFRACSFRWRGYVGGEDDFERSLSVYAVDTESRLHEWDVNCTFKHAKLTDTKAQYIDWKTTIPGVVSAIRSGPSCYGSAIFYQDDKGIDRVGFALKKWWSEYPEKRETMEDFRSIKFGTVRSFETSALAGVTHVKEERLVNTIWYIVYSSDGTEQLYAVDTDSDSKMVPLLYRVPALHLCRFGRWGCKKYALTEEPAD